MSEDENNRLLIMAERFAPDLGGVARSAARIARTISGMGVETEVFAWTRALPPGQLETTPAEGDDGVTVHRLGLFSNLDFSLQYTMNVIEWLHGSRGYRALWGHYLYPAGFMAVTLAQWLKIRSTVSARGNDVDRMMFPPGDFARLQWTLERADAVTAVSKDLVRKIDVLLGRDAGVRAIGNAVDPDVFSPEKPDPALRETLGIQADEAVLGFCGELRQKKGFPFLLQALVETRQQRSACLLVIGEARPSERATLSEFALDHPEAAERIIITGRKESAEEVAAHLRLCDVFLQPSIWDGMPNAVLEAMACERIVIASDAGGIPEMIESHKNGFVVSRAELNRLGEAVIEALGLSEKQQKEIGKAARKRVLEKFTREMESVTLRPMLEKLEFEM